MHERRGLVNKLLSIQPMAPVDRPLQRFGTGFGKPAFPVDITGTLYFLAETVAQPFG